MDGEFVTWDHQKAYEEKIISEFKRRDDENDRQNHRIGKLEDAVEHIAELVTSVKILATQMEAMATEQKKQGDRLEEIEKKPAKRWDVVITGALSAIVGALMAALMTGLVK